MGKGAVPVLHPRFPHDQPPVGPWLAPAPQFGQFMSISFGEGPRRLVGAGGGVSQTWKVLANSVKDAHASLENSSVAPSGPSLPSLTPTGPASGRAT